MALPSVLRASVFSKPGNLTSFVKQLTLTRSAATIGNLRTTVLNPTKNQSLVQKVSQRNFQLSAPRKAGILPAPTHWVSEKGLSVVVMLAIPAAIMMPGNMLLDNIVVISTVIHSHWGLESIVVDYVRPAWFGPVIPPIALMLLSGLTVFALGSLLYFNYNDVGFGKAVRQFWSHDFSKKKKE